MEVWHVWAAAITAVCGLIGVLYVAWNRKQHDENTHELATFESVSAEMRALRQELRESHKTALTASLEVLQCRREHAESLLREGEQQEKIARLESDLNEAHKRIREANELIAQLRADFNGFSKQKVE